jgi:hypothetical protein
MSAPPTKQLLIMQRLTAQLQTITPANGYDYDMSNSVYRGRTVFGADVPTPFISILEALRPDPRPMAAGLEKLKRSENWELLIQGWNQPQEDDPNPTDELYQLMGATMLCLSQIVAMTDTGTPQYPSLYRLGRVINSMSIGPGVVRAATPQYGGTATFYLPVTIGYAINVADPYSLA